MIYYSPLDGDVAGASPAYRPRTCFVMTKLGKPIPKEIKEIRTELKKILTTHKIKVIDANSNVTGKDFLLKIWDMIRSVPLGIAIITKDISRETLANIFYEIGLMQAYGKETLIIKTADANVPSDFIRTEYIEYKSGFKTKLNKYIKELFINEKHLVKMSEQLEKNPLLAIDYLRRAYLISGNKAHKKKAYEYKDSIGDRAKNSIESQLLDF